MNVLGDLEVISKDDIYQGRISCIYLSSNFKGYQLINYNVSVALPFCIF